jgi:signal transduction histidine kinase
MLPFVTTGTVVICIVMLLLLVVSLTFKLKRERDRAEFAESKGRLITDNLAAAVLIHTLKGEVVWCSPYSEVLTGAPTSEICEPGVSFLIDNLYEDDRESFKNALSVVASGEPFNYRYRFYHRSGLCLWLEARSVLLSETASRYPLSYKGVKNEPLAISVTLDVTASVNAQLMLEERNRDINEFTYMLSHDLKAPIATIRGMLEVIKEESGAIKEVAVAQISNSDPSEIEPIRHIERALDRLSSLVAGVLELARVSNFEGQLEVVQLRDVLSEVVEDYRIQIDQFGVNLEFANNLPAVLATKTQLYQLFSNLIGNAIKYRHPERQLQLAVKLAPGGSRRRVGVSICDNGLGIHEQFKESIFKPFSRRNCEVEGSGVGLAAVKKIAKRLGGDVELTSSAGEGSVFTVWLRR